MGCQLSLTVVILLLSGIVKGDITMDNLMNKGCYEMLYLLAIDYHELLPSFSLEDCINTCSFKSTRYFGINLRKHLCSCGHNIPENAFSRDDFMCNIMCLDASTRTCGGDWLMSVYDTQERTTAFPVKSLSENETTIIPYSIKSTMTSTISPLTTMTTDDPETTQLGDVKQVGCFGLSYVSGRQYHHKMSNITLKSCIQKCLELNSPFAGIAAKDKNCYCGKDILTLSPRVINFLCVDRCPDNQSLPCGGDWLMTVYDITKMLPPGNESDVEIMEDNVFLLIGHSDSVKLYNILDLDRPQLLFENDEGRAYGVDYHYDRKLMFVSTRSALYKTTLFPKNTSETRSTLILKMTGCEAFAVDWVHDKIFWVDCSGSNFSLKVIDLDGGNSTTIIKKMDGGAPVKRMVVDPYVGMLFWVNDGVIESSETNGANLHSNISNPDFTVRGLTLDISKQRLFYSGVMDFEPILYSSDYEGSDLKSVLRIPEMRGVYGMGIVRGVVYWINYYSTDFLYKAPLSQNSSTEIKMLKAFSSDSIVCHMKVVHPDHQKAPESDLCSSGTSSCPAQDKLDPKQSVAGELLLGMIVVGGVLVVVGLLMYLTDMKHWHLVRNKLARVGGADGTTT